MNMGARRRQLPCSPADRLSGDRRRRPGGGLRRLRRLRRHGGRLGLRGHAVREWHRPRRRRNLAGYRGERRRDRDDGQAPRRERQRHHLVLVEGEAVDVVVVVHEVGRDAGSEVLLQFHEVGLVPLRQDQGLHAFPAGRDDLLLDAAHLQDFACERQLPRHGQVRPEGPVERQADQRASHGDAGGGPVLRDGALRHVEVHPRRVQELVAWVQLADEVLGEGQRDRGGLGHHLPELACDLHRAAAAIESAPRLTAGLNVESGAAHRGPGQAHDDPGRGLARLPELVREVQRLPDVLREVLRGDGGLLLLPGAPHHAQGHLPGHLLEQLAELPHAGLARVLADHLVEGLVLEVDLVGADAALLLRLGDEVLLGDGHLLLVDVARDPHDLHAVQQRARDVADLVRRADEEGLRQVHGDVQVVVAEAAVLLRVQDLQQRGGRVPAHIAPELVDLVDQHHGVGALRDLHTLDQLPWHGADVGPPVPAQLGDVVHPAHGEAVELPVQGARDALADRRLADTGRADQAHDLALYRLLEEADRDVLQDALLHVLEPEVVLVKDGLRLLDVLVLHVDLPPGDAREPLQVCAADVELGGRRLDRAELRELGLDHLLHLLGDGLPLDGLAELDHQGLLLVLLDAELLGDLLHLLHQQHTALLLGDLLLNLGAHLGLQLRELEVLLDDGEDLLLALDEVRLREHRLQVLALRQGHAGDEVAELQRVVEVVELDHLVVLLLVKERGLEQLLHGVDDLGVQSLDLGIVLGHLGLAEVLDDDGGQRHVRRRGRDHFRSPHAVAGHDHDLAAREVGVLRQTEDLEHGPHFLQVRGRVDAAGVPPQPLGRRGDRGGAACAAASGGGARRHRPRQHAVRLGGLSRVFLRHEAAQVVALPAALQRVQEVEDLLLAHLHDLVEAGERRLPVQRQGEEPRRVRA
mmetsp:Transcript_10325/g.30663  ORF Transcript_10325/g.30663 Transcript_10325/m.30663 type:complete len:923 (+) Transcript_10325:165-2933(+)